MISKVAEDLALHLGTNLQRVNLVEAWENNRPDEAMGASLHEYLAEVCPHSWLSGLQLTNSIRLEQTPSSTRSFILLMDSERIINGSSIKNHLSVRS